jgi:virginiamycin B lyase
MKAQQPGLVLAGTLAIALCLTACGGRPGSAQQGAAQGTPSASSSVSAAPKTSMASLRHERLQAVVRVGGAPQAPDWQAEGFGSLWVANSAKQAVQRIDPKTDRVSHVVPVGAGPCDGLATGYGSVWAVDCQQGDLLRIDPMAGRVVARIPLEPTSDEGLIAAGAGGIWVLTGSSDVTYAGNPGKGTLVRIDPSTDTVTARVTVPPGSTAAAVGFGSVWVTSVNGSTVERVDPTTAEVAATIRVSRSPRFLAVGQDAVWVLNQTDGSVSRIDPNTNQVAATIQVHVPGSGGCIAAGAGAVWVTMPGTPLSIIDPSTNTVTAQYAGVGGDCISTAFGSVWLSNHELGNVWRLRVR